MGEDRPVLGCVGVVLELAAEQREELHVGGFERVAQLGEALDVVDVPRDRVPTDARSFVVTTDRAAVPAVVVERGLHRLDAEIADADQRREAVEVLVVVVGDPAVDAEHVVVPGVERSHVVGHVDDVEVAPDGEHPRQSPACAGRTPLDGSPP